MLVITISATAAAQSLSFSSPSLHFTASGTPARQVVQLVSTDGSSPLITLSDDPHAGEWLIFPGLTAAGEVTLAVRSGLNPGTYHTSLIATAAGYAPAEVPVTLTVEAAGSDQPRVTGVFPPNGSAGVSPNTSISANSLGLPNGLNGIFGVDNASINTNRVRLRKLPTGDLVPATVNGTGGGDAISLTPLLPLEPNTTYRFEIDGVTDLTGSPFELFYSVFTTGGGAGNGGGDLEQVSFTSGGTVVSGGYFTSLTVGPDGKFYGLSIDGVVSRWTIETDGSLSNRYDITTLTDTYGSRSSVGFTFSPTATAENLVAFITHGTGGQTNGPAWDGKLSRLSGPDLENEDLVITNLPRSRRDHLTNSIAFRPGEDRVLYFLQGSNSAGGAADKTWGNRRERLLSASALRLDLDKLPDSSWPLNAKTTMDAAAINSADPSSPTLGSGTGTYTEDGQTYPDDGTYNPYYTQAPLTLFATGIRNAFDLVWHSNGQLYVPTNGTAAGSNSPASINGTRRPDGSYYLYGDASARFPQVPAATGNNTQRDWLFRIDPTQPIGYYGHPNPLRGEFVLNRGSADANTYPAGVTADPNYRGAAYDFAYNISPNGVIEYRSNAENGNLKGALLVCRYSGGSDLIALVPDGPDGDIRTARIGIPGFSGFTDPLDLTEDPATGNLYVADFGTGTVVLLKPSNQATPQPVLTLSPERVVTDAVVGSLASTTIFIANTGNAALEGATVTLTGSQSAQFSLEKSGLPATLSANSSASVQLRFQPTSAGAKFATLTLAGTNVEPISIPLNGLGKNGLSGELEPSLQQIFDVYGLALDAGDPNSGTSLFDVTAAELNGRLGDEVALKQFQRATDGPVSLEVLSAFGPVSADPVVSFGWHESGQAGSATEVFSVRNPGSGNGQKLRPALTGATEFDPGYVPFGLYTSWAAFADRQVFGEDELNDFAGALPHQVRVYPLTDEPNAFVLAFDGKTEGYDYQDLVVLIRNVEPATGGDLVATPGELVFETTVNQDGLQSVTQPLTLTNNSLTTTRISRVELSGPFAGQFSLGGNEGFTLAPGDRRVIDVTYSPERNYENMGHQPAVLRIISDLNGGETLKIDLHGLKKAGRGGDHEPPLQQVVNTLGYPVNVGWTTLANHTRAEPQGEEVFAPTFRVAGAGVVTLRPLARYSSDASLPFGLLHPRRRSGTYRAGHPGLRPAECPDALPPTHDRWHHLHPGRRGIRDLRRGQIAGLGPLLRGWPEYRRGPPYPRIPGPRPRR